MQVVAEISEDSVTSIVAVKEGAEYASGVSARFMPLNQTWGFKMYNNLIEAYFTYFAQRLLASIGVSPKLGQQMSPIRTPFKVSDHQDSNPWGLGYGYLTESVKLIPKPDWTVPKELLDELNANRRKLKFRATEILGWEMGDLHSENVGWIESADGVSRWYIIDCGDGMVEHTWDDVQDLVELLEDNDLWRGDNAEYSVWGMPLTNACFPSKRL